MNSQEFIKQHNLNPENYRGSWAFCIGNPWENTEDRENLENVEVLRLADQLAELTKSGGKTATSSALADYSSEDKMPKVDGSYDIVLNSLGEAVCAIQTTKIYEAKFMEVSAEHARKEGEGDLTLTYWRQIHEEFFRETGLFSPEMIILCEEFTVIS
ncbi:MAG: ASCH domain-containing protein [Streptococcaceae bacterium]|jgi:uncharacterized protein YhfF|nr:ASCH domain-containing protein [Streptococcaceae bacterium]